MKYADPVDSLKITKKIVEIQINSMNPEKDHEQHELMIKTLEGLCVLIGQYIAYADREEE